MCRQYGFEPLLPIDHVETEPGKICDANLMLIRKAQIVVANLESFRGAEPDSGTCFEVGFAHALSKKVYGYVTQPQTVVQRVASYEASLRAKKSLSEGSVLGLRDRRGWSIEDFGLPANLMLAKSMTVIDGGLEACLMAIRPR